MERRDGLAELVGTFIADVIGFAFCLAVLSAAYSLGYAVAPYFGGIEHRDTFGLLAVINLIWVYEHQKAHYRWARLFNRDEHQANAA